MFTFVKSDAKDKKMISPSILKKGDKIAVIAPARKVTPEEIKLSIEVLQSWGLEVILGKNVYQSHHQFSGTDSERAADLQEILNDNSVSAIISVRGGYGTMRIIDAIDFKSFIGKPKWLIGFSDITVLHSHINNLGIESLHAPMLINFFKSAEATESIRKILFGEAYSISCAHHSLNINGNAEGNLVGGNLSLLYALTGTKYNIDTNGKILFIEDLDEYLYHLDRMMLNLKLSGKLQNLAGLVVGGITDMKDNQIPFGKNAEEIVYDAVKDYNFPVCFNFPAGHVDKNLALPMGRRAKLIVAETTVLSF
jgi:muramoyltetrapeptide carboxypeptidase